MSKILPLIFRSVAPVLLHRWNSAKANPIRHQHRIREKLVKKAAFTKFGREHHFEDIVDYDDFRQAIPVREYEEIRSYIEQIKTGTENILFPGRPIYFAKTSGTTSGMKYIPVYKEMLQTYSRSAIDMMFSYATITGNFDVFGGKTIAIQSTPALESVNGFLMGKMSGISYHGIPGIFKRRVLPSYKTRVIPDFESKMKAIVEEVQDLDIRAIGGFPQWTMYFLDYLLESKKKKYVKEIFPNLSLYAHAGVSFEPYRELFMEKIGGDIHTLDSYTSSEGHFGFQEDPRVQEMTLCSDNGIFFEFLPFSRLYEKGGTRIPLEEVQVGKPYAVVISTMSGLWGYLTGDTIVFTNTSPYQFRFNGRISQFTSLFGEHCIESEIHLAIIQASERLAARIRHVTVAPKLESQQSKSCHEWWIEFETAPDNILTFAYELNESVCRQNSYYNDLIRSKALSPLRIIVVQGRGFENCLASVKRLDAQSKIPVLSNDRKFVELLKPYSKK